MSDHCTVVKGKKERNEKEGEREKARIEVRGSNGLRAEENEKRRTARIVIMTM
jgi:hypothetical protein